MVELPARFGAYLLLEQIGSGGAGSVFLARPFALEGDASSQALVIKTLRPELSLHPEFLMRFQHEAALARAIDSPHVARVYEAGQVGGTHYLAMEYIAGWPLARIIRELKLRNSPPAIASVLELVEGALRGLAALHGARDDRGALLGAVHRDLSPRNIMLGEDGVTKLIDLGIGRSRMQKWRTAAGVVMGSVGYMAPEHARGGAIDGRADLYVVAMVLYELLTLEPYIDAGPALARLRSSVHPRRKRASEVRPEVPPALDAFLERSLALEPGERFPTAEAMIEPLLAMGVERSGRAIDLLIGELLWEELNEAKTKVSSLVQPGSPSITPVFPLAVFDEAELEPSMTADVQARGSWEPEERPPRPPARSASDWGPILGAVMLGALLASALWAVLLHLQPKGPEEEVVPVTLSEPAPPAPVVRVEERPVAVPVAAPAPEVEPTQERPASPPATIRRRPLVRAAEPASRERTEHSAAAPMVVRSAPVEASNADAAGQIDGLTARAMALRARYASGTRERKEAELILGALLQIRALARPESEAKKIDALAAQLRAVESR